MTRENSRVVRLTLVVALGGLLLAGAALHARASRSDPRARRLPGRSASNLRADPGSIAEAPGPESPEDVSTGSLDSPVEEFVARLKAEGASGDLALSLNEMLRRFPLAELLRHLARHGPLEQGFSALLQLVAESPSLRESAIRLVGAADEDPETRLFALRLLPPFALLTGIERGALLSHGDRPPEGELGRQLVRYVCRNPTEDGVSAWLSQLHARCGDPEVKADVLRALVRFRDPIAVSILKRCFDDPDVPVSQRAKILGALTATGAAQGAYARHPWLPEALERSIRFHPGDAFDSDQQELASYAITILAENGDCRKLSSLMDCEKSISAPGGRALIAFALRWLPEQEAAATLASMASNPEESPKVRWIAFESLRGRKSADVVQRLRCISSERGLPQDLKAALEDFLRE